MSLDQNDLNACDLEQIHLIDAVQPVGCMVVVDQNIGIITHISANASQVIGWDAADLLGQSLSELLDKQQFQQLDGLALRMPNTDLVKPWVPLIKQPDGTYRPVSCLAHLHESDLFLEFFANDLTATGTEDQNGLRQGVIDELRPLENVTEFSRAAVAVIRKLTGYDRVMCYRFHHDGHGEVIAESTEREDRYLGLHYPASDIPEPARRSFMLNKVRMIADIDDTPVPMLRAPTITAPADMTFAKLRAVSPVHVEYLRNMGVRATLALPLVVAGKIWGLMVCHHYAPRALSAIELHASELAAQMIELFFEGIIRTERDRLTIRGQQTAFSLSKDSNNTMSLPDIGALIGREFEADAVAIKLDGAWQPLWNWTGEPINLQPLHQHCTADVFTTDSLIDFIDLSDAQQARSAGGAFLSIDADNDEYVFLARREFEHEVHWAGGDNKSAGVDENGARVLTPRVSFALWVEEITGKSRPFSETDRTRLQTVLQSLRSLINARRTESLRRAKAELEQVQAELRSQLLSTARSASMGELAAAIAHELNQPLTSISNFVSACQRLLQSGTDEKRDMAIELMNDAVSEAQRAGKIVHHLRNLMRPGFESKSEFDFNDMIEQATRLAFTSKRTNNVALQLELSPNIGRIYADKVQLEQVVFNLVNNAVEAMDTAPERILTITSRLPDNRTLEVCVDDTGSGIAPELLAVLFEPFHTTKVHGMGIGLSLCRSTIEAHNGRIWGKNTQTGAQFGFSLPLVESEGMNGK